MPDVLTELDLLAPMMDPDLLLAEPVELGNGDHTVLDWGTQSLITDSIQQPTSADAPRPLDDDGLVLDLDDDEDIEFGRRAPEPLNEEPTMLEDDGLILDLGDDDLLPRDVSAFPRTELDDIPMMDDDFGGLDTTADLAAPLNGPTPARNQRDTLSPLSDIRRSVERDLEDSFQPNETTLLDSLEETAVEAAQRVKRRKLLQQDAATELPNTQIKAQQNDHSKILKPASFLPRDPMLLALMSMQKNGSFISSILGDGRSLGWAPELRDILSVDVVRRSGELKRKRDSGVSDLWSDEEQQSPKEGRRLEFDEEQYGVPQIGDDLGETGPIEEIPLNDGAVRAPSMEDDGMGPNSPPPDFDDTTYPNLHPQDDGPISQGTRHAVHLLRDFFGPEGARDAKSRQKNSALLQDLIPEKRTNRRDATKMFFEVLVLATKDAVKVEQDGIKKGVIGGPIRIRAKRGLYGTWAEAGAASGQDSQTQADAEAETETA
jgi:cohesin complex subunit SCC1